MVQEEKRATQSGWGSYLLVTATVVVVGIALVGGAVIAAHGQLVGGDDGADCTADPSRVGATFEEQVGVSVTPSYWPLGTDCTLTGPSGQRALIPKSDWTMTAVAVTGIGLSVAPVAFLPLRRGA